MPETEKETSIRDLARYLRGMRKSLLDKMFFVDKIFEPVEGILDFGCAGGDLIKALHVFYSDYRYIGYDLNEEMIRTARENVPNAAFYSDWADIPVSFDHYLLNCSSVIHEVYAYGSAADVEEFWDRVFHSGFQYISIRDMMLSDTNKCPAEPGWLAAVRAAEAYRDHLADFEDVYGPIASEYDLMHYLLKYRYTQNWDREVRENYLPITREALLALIPEDYEIVYDRHEVYPFLHYRLKKDFGIDLNVPTHQKLIIKRRNP